MSFSLAWMCLILTVVLFALYAFSPLTRFQLELSGMQGPFAALIFYLGGLLHVEGMTKSTWDLQLIFNPILTVGLGFTLALFVFLSLITLKEKQQLLHLKFSLLLGAGTILASQGFSLTLTSIEIQSYATYLILGSQNHLIKSYGHMTYFLMGSIGTLCLIFGWSLGASTGVAEGMMSPGWSFPLSFMISGVMIKLGLAPYHFWLPNAYNELEFSGILWVSSIPLTPFLYISYQFHSATALIWLGAGLSILFGGLGVLTSSKFKAFLALSSTANLGFLLVLKGYSVSALGLYLLFYVVSLAALLQLFHIPSEGSEMRMESPMSSTRGSKGNISKVLARTIVLLSFTGLPPLLGFYAKSVVFFPLTALGMEFTSLILTVLGLIAAMGYMRLAVTTSAPIFQPTRIEKGAGDSERLNLVALTVVYTAVAKSLNPYAQVFMFSLVALSLILPPLLVGMGYLLGTPLMTVSKTSSYECGFVPVKGQGHKPILMSFFTVGMLFLLFDLEILWMIPVVTLSADVFAWAKFLALLFFSFVVLSLIFETYLRKKL